MYAWRSFEAYPYLSDLAGVTSVRVPLRDETHDLAAMADAITERTRLIFVCNPNNPTGTAVHRAEAGGVPRPRARATAWSCSTRPTPSTSGTPTCRTGCRLYRDRPNVVVLRTFSKAYGLAGLRVGYMIAHEPVAAAVRKTLLPFGVNALAQAAAIASLEAEPELMARVESVVKERERVREELLGQGWSVPPTEANFVWLRLGRDTEDFTETCDRAGVAVRPYPPDGARVTIGDREANDALLAVTQVYPHRS